MDTEPPNEPPRTKRTDVGYKRPPVETQFKKGQKPPPRKKREARPLSATETLMKILREERRLTRDGKVVWETNAALLIEVAFQLAEKGNPTLSRALTDALMAGDKPEVWSDQPRFVTDPDCQGMYTTYERVKVE